MYKRQVEDGLIAKGGAVAVLGVWLMLLEFLLEAKSPTKLDLEVESDVESKDSEAVALAGIELFMPELFSSRCV